ncbi:signal peptidase I [Acetivibrio saccincola]|jgi:signal peptidase I|uniref:Signal peptidase I n=1 Tax=Acetivibrio saccincola TaxID=1677857 RepID=A0A2K9EQ91_9FIRM|nr:signal peptidase I [Acetivibrio saccincola]AUG58801.1 Signal peptidase I T [Acetivibrio saccincola]NLW26974.1 signal peptidase I [Acetivibrio saccincola]PQQ66100.1 signal peptidase I [Acetivibrio saccincola]HOA97773.1 signal peptidase I [Acetivibrio saccincola]HQD28948.1 signal peptidase I [Acetivibrio saccincola]
MKKVLKEILSWTLHIVIAVVCGLAINIFILQPTQVQGISMESTLTQNDRVIINKLMHTLRQEPDYGDIVVIDSRVHRPRSIKDDIMDSIKYNAISYFFTGEQEEVLWIKRVIGKEGDVLEFKDGKIYRNNELLEEPYINEPMYPSGNWTVTVPEGHVFVMGDNRNHSKDSRAIGAIPLDHVLGKYLFKF